MLFYSHDGDFTIMGGSEMSERVSAHYDAGYFDWQQEHGAFGGWANAFKFQPSISPNATVVDFGCGGGFLLKNLSCARRIGIEPNPAAAASARRLGVEHYYSAQEALNKLGPGVADVIISTNVLEHTLNPLEELKNLRPLLKKGGIIHFIVPCESIYYRYNPADINYHLFSWSPQCLGNIFSEAGFDVDFCRPYIHKWPPYYRYVAALGWPIFNLVCKLYGRLERSWFQVELRGSVPFD